MKACLQRTKTAEKENLFAESRSGVGVIKVGGRSRNNYSECQNKFPDGGTNRGFSRPVGAMVLIMVRNPRHRSRSALGCVLAGRWPALENASIWKSILAMAITSLLQTDRVFGKSPALIMSLQCRVTMV